MPTTVSSAGATASAAVLAELNKPGLRVVYDWADSVSSQGVKTPEFDVVAVHGLMGTRWSTWSHKDVTMWLEGLLPKKLPKARVMTLWYNANVLNNPSSFGIRDHARVLLSRLKIKRDKEEGRPIVFVCHSLGGVVVKQALCIANTEHVFEDIAKSTRGILFFGTPHRGSDLAFWGNLLAAIGKAVLLNPKREFIRDLKNNSKSLQDVSEDFRPIVEKYKIVRFYEESAMRGLAVVVPKHSALLEIPNEIVIPCEGDHKEICRFSAADEERFDEVWMAIRDIIGESETMKLSLEERSFLNSFSTFQPEDFFDETIQAPLSGTCTWVYGTSSFLEWSSSDKPTILHIYGKLGSGKSIMSRFLYEEGQRGNYWDARSYFSFSEQDEGRKAANKAYSSLIEQLLAQKPVLLRNMLKEEWYVRKTQSGSKTYNQKYLEKLIQSPYCGKTLMILDAVDECHSSEPQALKEFLARFCDMASGSTKLKMIIFSRLNSVISHSLRDAFKINLDLEPAVHRDIIAVIKTRVANLVDQRLGLRVIREEIEKSLIERADGMFLIVQLVLAEFDELEDTTRKNIMAVLKSLPKTIAEAYQRFLEKIPERSQIWAKRALTWILYASRPLTALELSHAVAFTDESRSLADIEDNQKLDFEGELKRTFGALLSPGIEKIQLVHQTARETLLNLERTKTQWFDIESEEGEYFMLKACVNYLCLPARSSQTSLALSRENADSLIAPLLDYAIENFPEHARQLPDHYQQGHQLTVQFLQSKEADPCERSYWEIRDPFRYDLISRPLHLACTLGLKNAARELIMLGPARAIRERDRSEHRTTLDIAVQAGIIEVVEQLVQAGADPNERNKDSNTALTVATRFGNAEIVRFLLDKAGAFQVDEALQAAAEAAQEFMMDILLQPESIMESAMLDKYASRPTTNYSSKNRAVQVVVGRAMKVGQVKTIRYLLDQGLRASSCSFNGANFLHLASMYGHIATIKLVLGAGCTVHDRDDNDQTPLHLAAKHGHEDACHFLLGLEADVHSTDDDGQPIFYAAAIAGQVHILKILLAHGCDIHKRNKQGDSVLDLAVLRTLDSYNSVKIAQFLLDQGAQVNDTDAAGLSSIHKIASKSSSLYGLDGRINLLLSRPDVDINLRDARGRTPLHFAAQESNVVAIRVLLLKGADPKIQDKDGRIPNFNYFQIMKNNRGLPSFIPKEYLGGQEISQIVDIGGRSLLSWAASEGLSVALKKLLDCDASTEIRDSKGRTPLWWAAYCKQKICAQLLLTAGADPKSRDHEEKTGYEITTDIGIKIMLKEAWSKRA